MERRLLLAIVLTFVVLTAYQWLLPMPQQPPPPQTAAPPATGTASPAPPTGASVTSSAPPPAASPAAEPAAPVETVRADTAERTITVENGVVRAVFSNRGATLVRWELVNYQ